MVDIGRVDIRVHMELNVDIFFCRPALQHCEVDARIGAWRLQQFYIIADDRAFDRRPRIRCSVAF